MEGLCCGLPGRENDGLARLVTFVHLSSRSHWRGPVVDWIPRISSLHRSLQWCWTSLCSIPWVSFLTHPSELYILYTQNPRPTYRLQPSFTSVESSFVHLFLSVNSLPTQHFVTLFSLIFPLELFSAPVSSEKKKKAEVSLSNLEDKRVGGIKDWGKNGARETAENFRE